MKGGLFLGSYFGIKVYVHWSFALLVGYVLYSSSNAGQDWNLGLYGVMYMLALFFCVTLHEFGHALAARGYGIPTLSITLLPIGGVARLKELPTKPGQELWVAFAGPLVNVVIAAGLGLMLYLTRDPFPTFSDLEGLDLPVDLLFANVFLVVFNLLPAFPMDGGRVLRAFLNVWLPRERATRIAASVGQLIAVGFVILGILYAPTLILVGVFVFLGAGQEAAMETRMSRLKGKKVREVVMRQITLLHPWESLGEASARLLAGQDRAFLVGGPQGPEGILHREALAQALAQLGPEGKVGQAAEKEMLILDAEMDLSEAFRLMTREQKSFCPVTENGQVIGMVDKENLEEFLVLSQAVQTYQKQQHTGSFPSNSPLPPHDPSPRNKDSSSSD